MLVASIFFVAGAQYAAAQDNPAPAGDTPPPADTTSTPADAAPATTEAAAPAEAAAPETVSTIPVDTVDKEAPAKDAARLDTVEVTGSRLRRTDYETSQPVLTLTREDIERTGLTDITQILRNISAAGNNSLSPQQGRFALTLGEANLDLRNLGANHTLLLVNGRRWISGLITTQTSVSDYNTIPTSIIERVEVLKDGASAIYGSDAIGGVVNVITRKDFEGGAVDYHFGQYIKEGDGTNQQGSLSWGMNRAKSNLFVNLSYTDQGQTPNENRALTASPNVGPTRSSIVTPNALIRFIPTQNNATMYMCPNLQAGIAAGASGGTPLGGPVAMTNTIPAGLVLCDLHLNDGAVGGAGRPTDYHQLHRNVPGDVYNRFADGTLTEPNERIAGFTQYRQEIMDGLTFNFEGLYNKRKSVSVGQNSYLGGGNLDGGPKGYLAYISATNTDNPFGQDVGNDSSCPVQGSPSCTGIGTGSGSWAIRRAKGLNNQNFYDQVDTYRASGSLNGDFNVIDHAFFYEGGYVYGTSKIKDNLPSVNYEKAGKALGVPGTTCTAAEGCVHLDVLQGQTGLTQAAINYIVQDNVQRNRSQQDIAYATVNTEIPLAAFLPAPLGVAIGAEYRKDAFNSTLDQSIKDGLLRLNTAKDLNGSTNAKEAYVELGLPLLKDLPFASALDLDLAGRYSKYPHISAVTTGKAGIRYQPFDDLLMRASYSTGFRAPNVGELFLGASQSFDPITDPCADPGTNATADANCTSDGTPGGGSGNNVATPYDLWSGNLNLKPETSKNLTYGLIYSPHWLPEFNLNVDFFDIKIDNFVTIGEGQYFLNSCYNVTTDATARKSLHCETIHRDGSGTLQYVDTPYFNLGGVETRGVDLGFDYVLPTPEQFGRFKFAVDSSYLAKYDFITPVPGSADQVDHVVGVAGGQFQGFPRWKGGANLNWKHEQFSANWATRMAYTLTEDCGDLFPTPSLKALGVCNYPDVTTTNSAGKVVSTPKNKQPTVLYHNVQVGYEIPERNATVTIGINNVLNQDPPISRSLSSLYFYNYDPNAYEAPGRLGYLQLGFKF